MPDNTVTIFLDSDRRVSSIDIDGKRSTLIYSISLIEAERMAKRHWCDHVLAVVAPEYTP